MATYVTGYPAKGLCKVPPPTIRDNYGSGLVGPGLTQEKIIGKSSQNYRILVLIYLGRVTCVFYLCIYYMFLKAVSYYDLSIQSMSVMGLKKSLDRAWVGGLSSIQFILDFLNFLTSQSP